MKKMLIKVVKHEPAAQDKLSFVDSDSVNPNINLYDGHSSLSLSLNMLITCQWDNFPM